MRTLSLFTLALITGALTGAYLSADRVINTVPCQLWTMLIAGVLLGSAITLGALYIVHLIRGGVRGQEGGDRTQGTARIASAGLSRGRERVIKHQSVKPDPFTISAEELKSLRREF
jgi:hypothetical protein